MVGCLVGWGKVCNIFFGGWHFFGTEGVVQLLAQQEWKLFGVFFRICVRPREIHLGSPLDSLGKSLKYLEKNLPSRLLL